MPCRRKFHNLPEGMVYVVVEGLIPEMSEGKHSHVGIVLFAAGFTVMMALG